MLLVGESCLELVARHRSAGLFNVLSNPQEKEKVLDGVLHASNGLLGLEGRFGLGSKLEKDVEG